MLMFALAIASVAFAICPGRSWPRSMARSLPVVCMFAVPPPRRHSHRAAPPRMLLAACEGSRSSGLDRAAEVRRGVSRNGDVAGRLRGEDRALLGERTHRGVPADDVDLPRAAAVVGIARSQCGHAPGARDHVKGRGAFLRERRWWQER